MIFEVRIGFAHFCCNGLLVCPLTVKSILSPFKGRMICQVFSVCSFVLLVLFVCLLDYGLDNASDRLGRYLSGDGFVSCSRFSRIVFLQQQRPENSSKQKNSLRLFSILFAFNNVGEVRHSLRNDGRSGNKEVINFFQVILTCHFFLKSF